MYEYKATIISVVDGDTVHAQIDLGFDQYCNKTLRLAGIDAPEISTQEGMAAKLHLIGILGLTKNVVTITTIKDRREKYGRYLATIYIGLENINQQMIDDGFVIAYEGGAR